MIMRLLAWGMLVLLGMPLVVQAEDDLLSVRVNQGFDQTMEQAQEVLNKHGFSVAHIQQCDGGLQHMGYETDQYKLIFFGKLDDVRELSKIHPELIPFFPFKLAVYAEGKDTLLSVINPSSLGLMLRADAGLQAKMQGWEQEFRAVLGEVQSMTQVAKAP
jgi:uncharacterized protein (DUF302 family)